MSDKKKTKFIDPNENFKESIEIGSQKDTKLDNYFYKVMSRKDTEEEMESLVQRCLEYASDIHPGTVKNLLNSVEWDVDKFIEKYFDDKNKMYEEANLISPEPQDGQREVILAEEMNEQMCEICISETPSNLMFKNDCGHPFCRECWKGYVTSKIINDGCSQTIVCPGQDCNIITKDEVVTNFISDPKVLGRYNIFRINNFVDVNKRIRWCPNENCDKALLVHQVEPKLVTCTCGKRICFSCGKNWHRPVKCDLFKKWLQRFENNFGTNNWIIANTKNCPQCNSPIEKNGGCNHMICRKASCNYDFCWICLTNWYEHEENPYSCNRYDVEKEQQMEFARDDLKRFFHYNTRYMNHELSLKLEMKLYDSIMIQMKALHRILKCSWMDVQFLRSAVEVLRETRQILMYTYVFAFFLKWNNQKAIFEDNQRDLEFSVETLSGYLEGDLTTDKTRDIKAMILNNVSYCKSRCQKLCGHVEEGFNNGWWIYRTELM